MIRKINQTLCACVVCSLYSEHWWPLLLSYLTPLAPLDFYSPYCLLSSFLDFQLHYCLLTVGICPTVTLRFRFFFLVLSVDEGFYPEYSLLLFPS